MKGSCPLVLVLSHMPFADGAGTSRVTVLSVFLSAAKRSDGPVGTYDELGFT